MENKESTSDVIASYRKRRQQSTVIFVYGAAGLLVLAGVVLLVLWLTGPSHPMNALFATRTPTPTLTSTPTITPPASDTPTITPTATGTPTLTPSAPFTYTVQQGDSLTTISDAYKLGDDGIALILLLNPFSAEATDFSINQTTQAIYPSQKIWLPDPNMKKPTSTPIPSNIARGTIVTYTVVSGDSLAGIASKYNSTVDDIVKANQLADANSIFIGEQLKITVNLVTPTQTRPPTSTPRTPLPPTP